MSEGNDLQSNRLELPRNCKCEKISIFSNFARLLFCFHLALICRTLAIHFLTSGVTVVSSKLEGYLHFFVIDSKGKRKAEAEPDTNQEQRHSTS